MRRLFGRVTEYKPSRMYYRTIMSYVFLVIITLVILSLLVYSTFVDTLQKNLETLGINEITQLSQSVDNQLREMERTALHISSNPKLLPFFATGSPRGALDAVEELKKYVFGRSFLQDILVMYERDPLRLYGGNNLYSLQGFQQEYRLPSVNEEELHKLFRTLNGPSLIAWEQASDRFRLTGAGKQYVYMYPLPVNSSEPYAIVFFLLHEDFLGQFQRINAQYHANLRIYDTREGWMIDSLVTEVPVASELFQGKEREFKPVMRMKYKDEDFSILQHRSSYNRWIYRMEVPTAILMNGLNRGVQIFNYTAAILMFIGLLWSFIFAELHYKPLRRLVGKIGASTAAAADHRNTGKQNEFHYIENMFEGMTQTNLQLHSELRVKSSLARDRLLLQLLSGQKVDENMNSRDSTDEAMLILNLPCFVVFYYQIDDYERFSSNCTLREQDLLKFSIINIMEELSGELGRGYGLNMLENMGGVLLLNTDPDRSERELLEEMAGKAKLFFKKHFKYSLTIGVSDPRYRLEELPGALKEAIEAASLRYLEGDDQIIFYEDLPARGINPSFVVNSELELKQTIRQGDPESVRLHIEEWFRQIREETHSVETAKHLAHGLIHTLRRSVKELFPLEGLGIELELQEMLSMKYETLNRMKQDMISIAMRLCEEAEKRKLGGGNTNVEEVMNTIHQKYTDYHLTLDAIARMHQLSPSYLTKLFKSHTGQSLMNYVDKLRLAKAKELLQTTDMTLREILPQCGYLDETNFIRKFKKNEGVTPIQYRQWVRFKQEE